MDGFYAFFGVMALVGAMGFAAGGLMPRDVTVEELRTTIEPCDANGGLRKLAVKFDANIAECMNGAEFRKVSK